MVIFLFMAASFSRFRFHILRKRLARHIAPLVCWELMDPPTAAWVIYTQTHVKMLIGLN